MLFSRRFQHRYLCECKPSQAKPKPSRAKHSIATVLIMLYVYRLYVMWLFTLAAMKGHKQKERSKRQWNSTAQIINTNAHGESVWLTRWEKRGKNERARIKRNYTLNLQCCTFKLAVPFNSMLFECSQEFPLQSEEREQARAVRKKSVWQTQNTHYMKLPTSVCPFIRILYRVQLFRAEFRVCYAYGYHAYCSICTYTILKGFLHCECVRSRL